MYSSGKLWSSLSEADAGLKVQVTDRECLHVICGGDMSSCCTPDGASLCPARAPVYEHEKSIKSEKPTCCSH